MTGPPGLSKPWGSVASRLCAAGDRPPSGMSAVLPKGDEQWEGVFAPEIPVGDDATPQQRLLAYTGRHHREI